MAEVPFRPVHQLSEYKGKGASASREEQTLRSFVIIYQEDEQQHNFICSIKPCKYTYCRVALSRHTKINSNPFNKTSQEFQMI